MTEQDNPYDMCVICNKCDHIHLGNYTCITEQDAISKALKNALDNLGINMDDLFEYYFCGSNYKRKEYFKQKTKLNRMPEFKEHCLCGHKIKENYYITKDNKDILILGSCCIKRFIPTGFSKTCDICGNVHRNIKFDLCNDCKEDYGGTCVICNGRCYLDSNRCKGCKNKCVDCKGYVKIKYIRCYKCNLLKKQQA